MFYKYGPFSWQGSFTPATFVSWEAQHPTSSLTAHHTGGDLLGSPQALPKGHGLAVIPGHQVKKMSYWWPALAGIKSKQSSGLWPWTSPSDRGSIPRAEGGRAPNLLTDTYLIWAKRQRSSQSVWPEQKVSCNLEPSSNCRAMRTWGARYRNQVRKRSSYPSWTPDQVWSLGHRRRALCLLNFSKGAHCLTG